MTAPLCGRLSIPPDAMPAIRGSSSGFIPIRLAQSRLYLPNVSSAIPIPPEVEPVIPDKTLTVTASESSGLALVCQRGHVNVYDRSRHCSGGMCVGRPYGSGRHCSGRKCVAPDNVGRVEPAPWCTSRVRA